MTKVGIDEMLCNTAFGNNPEITVRYRFRVSKIIFVACCAVTLRIAGWGKGESDVDS